MAESKGMKSTTIWLTPEDRQIIEKLEKQLGLKQVQIIRLAIRKVDKSQSDCS